MSALHGSNGQAGRNRWVSRSPPSRRDIPAIRAGPVANEGRPKTPPRGQRKRGVGRRQDRTGRVQRPNPPWKSATSEPKRASSRSVRLRRRQRGRPEKPRDSNQPAAARRNERSQEEVERRSRHVRERCQERPEERPEKVFAYQERPRRACGQRNRSRNMDGSRTLLRERTTQVADHLLRRRHEHTSDPSPQQSRHNEMDEPDRG